MLDLEELERLAKAATPGPWVVEEYGDPDTGELCWYIGMKENETHNYWDVDSSVLREMDAAFIAAANPQTVLDLIALARRAGGWISIDERLPPEHVPVPATSEETYYAAVYHVGGRWYDATDYDGMPIPDNMTYWYDVPPPPGAPAPLPTSED